MKKNRAKRANFEIKVLGHRIRVYVQKTPPDWVVKKYRHADGAWHVDRKKGLRIWVHTCEDRMLAEDVFLHECGHAILHIMYQYRDEPSWSEPAADGIACVYWEMDKGLKKIRELYGRKA